MPQSPPCAALLNVVSALWQAIRALGALGGQPGAEAAEKGGFILVEEPVHAEQEPAETPLLDGLGADLPASVPAASNPSTWDERCAYVRALGRVANVAIRGVAPPQLPELPARLLAARYFCLVQNSLGHHYMPVRVYIRKRDRQAETDRLRLRFAEIV